MTIQEAIKQGYDIDRLRASGKISPAAWAEYDSGKGEQIESLTEGGAEAEAGHSEKMQRENADQGAADALAVNSPYIKYILYGVGAFILYNFFIKK